MDFTIKSGDLLPAISAQLTDADGDPMNLTGCTVHFVMRDPTAAAPKVDHSATIVSAVQGQVTYFWSSADTDTPGLYDGSWVVTDGAGNRQTYPTEDYLEISVELDLSKTGGALVSVRPTDGIRPSVSAVGALLANRGINRQGIQFGFDSKPSYSQVQSIIDTCAGEIDGELLGVPITAALASLARWCILLISAATVELTFFPEQATSQGDSSNIWWSRYQLALGRFRTLVEQSGSGGPAQFTTVVAQSWTQAAAIQYTDDLVAAGLMPDDIWTAPPEWWT